MKKIAHAFIESNFAQGLEYFLFLFLVPVKSGAAMWVMGVVILTDLVKERLLSKMLKFLSSKRININANGIIRSVLLLSLLTSLLILPSWWKLVPGCIIFFVPTLLSVFDLIATILNKSRRQRYNSWEF